MVVERMRGGLGGGSDYVLGKSGSPAPKPMTFSPAALRALARASTASVGKGEMDATRWDKRPSEMARVLSLCNRTK